MEELTLDGSKLVHVIRFLATKDPKAEKLELTRAYSRTAVRASVQAAPGERKPSL